MNTPITGALREIRAAVLVVAAVSLVLLAAWLVPAARHASQAHERYIERCSYAAPGESACVR